MTLDYQKAWESMNSLEAAICKACSVKEVIDSAITSIENRDFQKAENLMNAANELLEYFVDDFDEKFKIAWKETISKMKQQDTLNKDWEAFYYPEEYSDSTPYTEEELDKMTYKEAINEGWEMTADGFWIPPENDKVVKWRLPIEKVEDDYFITFPDDLMEAANLKPGDHVNWIDQEDGSFILKKIDE